MKAYAIKNENDYYYTLDEDRWDDEIYRAFTTKDKKLAEEIANEYNKHKKEDEVSCDPIEITIAEGDLEEKYKTLLGVIHLAMGYACENKTLYKRMQDFNVITNRHNGDNYVYLEDAICFLTKLNKDARDEARKHAEFFEKVYQEQKAKENKDV